ncbi:MAG: MFS transporter [Methylacidiphilales bacterium]|nr:MFS transporter [Candidatus Methylacidiphilales bacterium]
MTSRSEAPPAPDYSPRQILTALVHPAVIVGALGYFVDIYDLVLFGVVRVASLKDLGLTGDQITTEGTWLINVQMGGMLLGGLLWGLLGDRFGRLKILFGSIILYSLANLANGCIHDLSGYTVCRFLAGVGLAGELGGGITLVTEILPRTLRGYGTMMVSAIGVLGAVLAGTVGLIFAWRHMYFLGGSLGLVLLFLRLAVSESGLYQAMAGTNRPTFASQLVLLAAPRRLGRYLCCGLIGLPCWYVIGLLILFSPEFGKALGATAPIVAGKALAYAYTGICLGDVASNLLSQFARARKSVLLAFLVATFVLINVFFILRDPTPETVYAIIFLVGIAVGYWSVFVTIAAEHFGTNVRATVATTVPNFTRGAVIPITSLYLYLKPHFGIIPGALTIGYLSLALALIGWFGLRETFHDDLDYLEK